MTSSSANEGATADGPTGESELRQVRERAETIRDEEVARAYSRLAARGDLTPEERAAVAELADRIVEELLAAPARGVAGAAENEAVAEAVRELFLE
ncbi:hypothetical protein OB920_16090 [Halobacteria archaeon HArc-gm2]|nr:hypothetical protein [Halobacteria archaeon HArc-gm2]